MNIHLRRRQRDVAAATTTTTTPAKVSPKLSCSAAANGHDHHRRAAASPKSTCLPGITATKPTPRGADSRPRTKERQRIFRARARHNTSSNHTCSVSPLSCHPDTNQHHRSSPPPGIASRCKLLFSNLRWQIHLLKFNFLLQFDRLQTWLSAKVRRHRFTSWLKTHFARKELERHRLFPKGPSSCKTAQQHQAPSVTDNGGPGISEDKRSKIRRLSQSTVRSLKKACSLNSERDELREADRRAMERLDELWRARDV